MDWDVRTKENVFKIFEMQQQRKMLINLGLSALINASHHIVLSERAFHLVTIPECLSLIMFRTPIALVSRIIHFSHWWNSWGIYRCESHHKTTVFKRGEKIYLETLARYKSLQAYAYVISSHSTGPPIYRNPWIVSSQWTRSKINKKLH